MSRDTSALRKLSRGARPVAAALAAFVVIGQASTPFVGAAAAAPAPPPPVDGGWPRSYDLPSGGAIVVYQPQVASWDKQKHLVAFSAVSYRPKEAQTPTVGTIKLEADTSVALTDRVVHFQNMRIAEAN